MGLPKKIENQAIPSSTISCAPDKERLAVIYNKLRRQCPNIFNYGNHDWLKYPSVGNALLFVSAMYEDRQRKYGDKSLITHPVEVAHGTVNFLISSGVGSKAFLEFAAFVALHHDTLEDWNYTNGKRTPEEEKYTTKLILKGWEGNDLSRFFIMHCIQALTDPDGLEKEELKQIQIDRAISFSVPYHGLIPIVRTMDKFYNTFGDFKIIFDSLILSASPTRINGGYKDASILLYKINSSPFTKVAEGRFKAANRKTVVIDSMPFPPISETIKDLYKIIVDCLKTAYKHPEQLETRFISETLTKIEKTRDVTSRKNDIIEFSILSDTLEEYFTKKMVLFPFSSGCKKRILPRKLPGSQLRNN